MTFMQNTSFSVVSETNWLSTEKYWSTYEFTLLTLIQMFKSFQMCNKRRLKITLLSVQNCELGLKYQELSLEVLTMGLVKKLIIFLNTRLQAV